MTLPSISVVLPVYNEEANLASVTQEWLEALAALGLRHKILLIDDGSKDRTPEIAADLAARHPGRVAHVRKTNSGHGRSCRHGYDLAIAMDTAWILQVDSDGQCDPRYFAALWAALLVYSVFFRALGVVMLLVEAWMLMLGPIVRWVR